MNQSEKRKFFLYSLFFNSSYLHFDIFPLGPDPHIFADPDPGSQNVMYPGP